MSTVNRRNLAPPSVGTYEDHLNTHKEWALNEGGLFFEQRSRAHLALRKIAKRLDALKIPYAVSGAMALFHHGYRRFTEDVDLLVSRQALREIHQKLEGLGYVVPFAGSRNLRDVETGVRVEFILEGDFPGDGK